MRSDNSKGFTIVELLIVIVVIGILAAISIVAYNGIQERARISSVSSALSQAAKKLAVYQVDNPDLLPADKAALEAIGIKDSESVTYQYSKITTNPDTYCITATTGTTSYKLSSSAPTPSAGGCAGHGVGGVAAITNRVLNPSFENGTAANGANISASGGTRTFPASGALFGSRHMRATFSSATALGWGQFTDTLEVGTYTASFYVRSNITGGFQPYLEGSSVRTTVSQSGNVTLSPNTWARGWVTFNVTTAGTAKVGGYFTSTSPTPTVGVDYVDFDGIAVNAGSTLYNYADGLTTNWAWNGTANAATSSGPPV